MKPPSDVIVLSVKEPKLSLPLLLDALETLSVSLKRSGVATGSSLARDDGGEPLLRRRRASAVELVCDFGSNLSVGTGFEALDVDNLLEPDSRRGVASKSRIFRLGDECTD